MNKELRKMKAAEIRDLMGQLSSYIDELHNEYEEYEQELERRGLKV